MELRIEVNRNYRSYIRKTKTTTDKHGVRKKIIPKLTKSQANRELDSLMSLNYVSSMTSRSRTTVNKYRKIQDLTCYSKKEIITVDYSDKIQKTEFENMFKTKRFGYGYIFEDNKSYTLKQMMISKRLNGEIKLKRY